MKALVVDDFICRKVLQTILSRLGECDVAVDGSEALEAFRIAIEEKSPYDLVCLDIMMPGMDGHEVLREIREIEVSAGVGGLDGVKVVMTTALDGFEDVRLAFRDQCDGYLVKPLDRKALLDPLRSLALVPAES